MIEGRGFLKIIVSHVVVLPASRSGHAPLIWLQLYLRCQKIDQHFKQIYFKVRECQLLVARNEAEAHTTLMDEYIRAVYR